MRGPLSTAIRRLAMHETQWHTSVLCGYGEAKQMQNQLHHLAAVYGIRVITERTGGHLVITKRHDDLSEPIVAGSNDGGDSDCNLEKVGASSSTPLRRKTAAGSK